MANYLNFDVGTLFPYLRFSTSFALLITDRKVLNNLTQEGKVTQQTQGRKSVSLYDF